MQRSTHPTHPTHPITTTLRRLAAASLGAALIFAPAAHADEIIVPTDMPLSIALATAVSGDTITLLPSGSPYVQFPGYSFANKRLKIRGSTGDRADVVIDGLDLDIVLRISGAGADGSEIENLTIRGGRGGTTTDASGGGIWISGANITIRNCIIEDNTIPGADGNGAGVYATQGDIRIEDTVIRNNTVPSSLADGGGVYFNGGNHVIVRTMFLNNGVANGTALGAGSIGGGFYADNGAAQISGCIFEGNRAGTGGGIGVSGNMVMTIDACRFIGNEARQGGGYYMPGNTGGGTNRIRNSVFLGNTGSVNDSAIFTSKALTITNCTLVGNTSPSYVVGGAPPAGSVIIDNCIVRGNMLNAANGLFPAPMAAVARRNILQQTYTLGSGTGNNRVIDPLFTDEAAGDFTLQPTSPAIDSGDSNLYFGPFADLAGNPRAVDDPNTPDTGFTLYGPVIDVGAYEFPVNQPSSCPADFDGNEVVNSNDISAFLSAWLQAVGVGCP